MGFLLFAARALRRSPLDLALAFDGHLYILIARTLPAAYQHVGAVFPGFPEGPYLTIWFPLYPVLLRMAGFLLGDLRLGALAISIAASSTTVVLVFHLAREVGSRPLTAALLTVVATPFWLLAGSLALVEPLLALLVTSAVYLGLRRRRVWASIAGGLAVVAQKSGLLALPLLAAIELRRGGLRGLRRLWPLVLATLPLAGLQLYVGHVFGDPFANLKVLGLVFQGGLGSSFGAPFLSWVRGFLHPAFPFVPLRPLIALALAVYLGALVVALARRDLRLGLLPVWIGLVLAFNACLAGPWPYIGLGRFLTLAWPAAACAWASLVRVRLNGARTFLYGTAMLLACYLLALRHLAIYLLLMTRSWSPEYFRDFHRYVLR